MVRRPSRKCLVHKIEAWWQDPRLGCFPANRKPCRQHVHRPADTEKGQPVAKRPSQTKTVQVTIPADLHRKFKTKVAQEGAQMTTVLREAIERYVKER